jgi:serine/threonine-protein kinase
VIEEEIAIEISERLRVRIAGEDAEMLHRHPSQNAEAYRLFLIGRFHCEKRTSEGLRKGIALYHDAIELDPAYALAYAGIAEAYNLLGFYMHQKPDEAFPRARAGSMKALSLDPQLAEAHCARAYTYFYYEWDWENAERAFRRSIELDPALANVRQFYGAYLMAMNRLDEAFAQIAAAEDLDPLGLPVKTAKGWFLCLARRYEEGIADLEKTIELDRSFATARQVIGWCLALSGRLEDALGHFRMIAGRPDAPTFYRSSLAYVLALAGQREEAEAILAELLAESSRYVSPLQLATICGALHDHDGAFHHLDEAVRQRAWQLVMLPRDARLDVLRDDPRFPVLLAILGLTGA